MKKLITIICLCLFIAACASDKNINGKEYNAYGIFTQDEKNECVVYHLSPGSIFWSIVLCETIVVPVLIVGFDLWEPVKVKENCK